MLGLLDADSCRQIMWLATDQLTLYEKRKAANTNGVATMDHPKTAELVPLGA